MFNLLQKLKAMISAKLGSLIIKDLISSCSKCPLRHSNHGQGEHYDYCAAPGAPKDYGNLIPVKRVFEGKWDWLTDEHTFPVWCPLPGVPTKKSV